MGDSIVITEELKETIRLLHKKYTCLIQDLPGIDSIEVTSDLSCWAQFLTDDLYNKKYILYINPEIEEECLQFKENTLFHEFTHMADSIKYSYLSLKDFKDFMFSYSEVHASEIQMDRMLTTQEKRPYSLEQQVIHGGYILLKCWMNQALNHVVREFELPKTSMPQPSAFDLREVFYFIGYLKSLQKNNISYEYDYSQVPHLKDDFYEITELLLNEQSDSSAIICYYRKLESQVNKILCDHKQTISNQVSALIADYDNVLADTIKFLKESTPNFNEEEFMKKITQK